MHALITQGLERNIFQIKAVSNKKGDVIAALCYTLFKDRFTYLIPVSNEQGKKDSAMFYLVDHLIRKASGTDILLDFEGSSIPGVAQFYRGFGAVNQPYHIIQKAETFVFSGESVKTDQCIRKKEFEHYFYQPGTPNREDAMVGLFVRKTCRSSCFTK